VQKSLISKDYRLFLLFLIKTRRDAGLTQEKLAKKLKATQSFVSKCERGERRIDVIELRWWARALGLTLTVFVVELENYMKKDVRPKT